MQPYLRRARRALFKGTIKPFQLKYVLDEPGNTPAKIMETAEFVWRFFNKAKHDFGGWREAVSFYDCCPVELKDALCVIGSRLSLFNAVVSSKRKEYADNTIKILRLVLENYETFDQVCLDKELVIGEQHAQYVRERHEYIDNLNKIRSEVNPGSRPLKYSDNI